MGILFQSEDGVDDLLLDSSEHFEGVEKRLQVEFYAAPYGDSRGLRGLSRIEIEQLLSAARCSIVKEMSNDEVDSYVLSESSLFVYSHKLIIKTCGTTQLLNSLPILLNYAAQLSLRVKGCRYSRGTFNLPDKQLFPHGNFTDEVEILNSFFGNLGCGSKAYLLSNPSRNQNWHVYASSDGTLGSEDAVYTLEMSMTQLNRKKASKFFKAICNTAAEMTIQSGIANLLPSSAICDFAFDPCGYSMNSLEGNAISTIHVTPEKEYSYASIETVGYGPQNVNLCALVNDVLECFRPGVFSVTVHVSGISGTATSKAANSWLSSVSSNGYSCTFTRTERLLGDELIMFQTFRETSSVSTQKVLSADCVASSLKNVESSLCRMNNTFHMINSEVEQVLFAMNPAVIEPTYKAVDEVLRKQIDSKTEDAFYVMDVGVILRLWQTWRIFLPRVHPFYAVKCNSDKPLLSLLSALGAGFDVASKAELDIVKCLGVGGDRIIFANPCKLPSHIVHAAHQNVHLTTFDSESELIKLQKLDSQAEVVLRIRVSDPGAKCPLGVKYGADIHECQHLLTVAKTLGIQVVGVAFHVGSGASDPDSFATGIAQARQVFDMANVLGITTLRLLDIGGGFVSDGGHGVSFTAAADAINVALDKFFPLEMGISVIAEPGRFFAEEPFTLATQIFGNRLRMENGQESAEYWVNDGIYGSMNCLLYDHAILSVRPLIISTLECNGEGYGNCVLSTIFGPTCDGLDTIMQGVMLPHMKCGDWLIFPRMGAYTKAAASNFNGFDISGMKTLCVCSMIGGS